MSRTPRDLLRELADEAEELQRAAPTEGEDAAVEGFLAQMEAAPRRRRRPLFAIAAAALVLAAAAAAILLFWPRERGGLEGPTGPDQGDGLEGPLGPGETIECLLLVDDEDAFERFVWRSDLGGDATYDLRVSDADRVPLWSQLGIEGTEWEPTAAQLEQMGDEVHWRVVANTPQAKGVAFGSGHACKSSP